MKAKAIAAIVATLATAGVCSAQSLSPDVATELRALRQVWQPYFSRGATGDFRNHFQNRIDMISQPRIQYYRQPYIKRRHPNHGMNVRYQPRDNWRREVYFRKQAEKRQLDQLATLGENDAQN